MQLGFREAIVERDNLRIEVEALRSELTAARQRIAELEQDEVLDLTEATAS